MGLFKSIFKIVAVVALIALAFYVGPFALGKAVAGFVGAATVSTATATLIGSLVLAGAGLAVSYLTRPSPSAGLTGGRYTADFNTQNKLLKSYGTTFLGGSLFYAEIKNSNNTMAFAMALSHTSSTEVWTVGEIWRNNSQLLFNGINVSTVIDNNNTSTQNQANKIRVRIYSGGTAAVNQVFPVNNKVPAYGGTSTSKSCQIRQWTGPTDHPCTDLLFAIVEVDYDAKNSLTDLGSWQFQASSNITNPADVFTDYFTNDKYGAGQPLASLDTDGMASWRSYCDQQIQITNNGTLTTQPRFRCNGVLDTQNNVLDNLNTIAVSGGSEFSTYSNKLGKWTVIVGKPNAISVRTITRKDIDSEFKVSFDRITFNSTYNQANINYANAKDRDKVSNVIVDLEQSAYVVNELPNSLPLTLSLTNNAATASLIGKRLLKRNRFAKRFSMTLLADVGSTLSVGDVISLDIDIFGTDSDQFIITRIEDVNNGGPALVYNISLDEYNSNIYIDEIFSTDLPRQTTGISSMNSLLQVPPVLGNYVVCDNPATQTVNVFSATTGAVISSNLPFASLSTAYATAIQRTYAWYGVEFTTPAGVSYDYATITASANNFSKTYTFYSPNSNTLSPSTMYVLDIPSLDLPKNTPIAFNIQLAINNSYSATANAVQAMLNPYIPLPNIPVELILSNYATRVYTAVADISGANGFADLFENGVEVTTSNLVTFTIAGTTGIVGQINNVDNSPIAGQPKGYYRIQSIASGTTNGSINITATYNGKSYVKAMTFEVIQTGIERVSVLPTIGNFDGRVVILLSDDRAVYRWNGTEWLNDVAASAISGQIVNTQIGDDAVTSRVLAANSVLAENIVGRTITGDKLNTTGLITFSAQIGDAVVNTLQLAGNAVTIPSAVSAVNTFATSVTSNSPTGFCSLTVTGSGGQAVIQAAVSGLLTSSGVQNVAGLVTVTVSLQKNGVTYASKSYDARSAPVGSQGIPTTNSVFFDANFLALDTATANVTTTWSILVSFLVSTGQGSVIINGSSSTNSNATLLYLEAKR